MTTTVPNRPDGSEACVICGRPATTCYPPDTDPDSASPSCGGVVCEIRIQAAIDYHEEVGNR
jgi:hypothetical protein